MSNLCNFQLFEAILKEISAIKNCEIAGGKKINEPLTFSVKFRVFLEENFSEAVRCIGLKFSEITETVMPFQYSEFLLVKVISIC